MRLHLRNLHLEFVVGVALAVQLTVAVVDLALLDSEVLFMLSDAVVEHLYLALEALDLELGLVALPVERVYA